MRTVLVSESYWLYKSVDVPAALSILRLKRNKKSDACLEKPYVVILRQASVTTNGVVGGEFCETLLEAIVEGQRLVQGQSLQRINKKEYEKKLDDYPQPLF